MYITKTARKYVIMFYGTFLLGGILHELTYGVPFTHELERLVYFAMTLAWISTVKNRITDTVCRKLMLVTSYLYLCLIVLQCSDYSWCYPYDEISYWLKQLFYAPMIFGVMSIYYLALCTAETPERQRVLLKKNAWLTGVAAAMLVFILTNDMHRQFFDYSGSKYEIVKGHTFEWGFFVYCGLMALMVILSLANLLKKTKFTVSAKDAVKALIPTVIGMLLLIKDSLGIRLFPWSHGFYMVGECYGITMFSFIEAMIQIGLIPSNTGYNEFFEGTGVPACIRDDEGRIVFQTKGFSLLEPGEMPGAGASITLDEDTLLTSRSLSAGSVTWADDLSEVNRLNLQLDLVNERLKEENQLIEKENRLKEERSKIETSVRLYENIDRAVAQQSVRATELLKDLQLKAPEDQKKALAKAAFLTAYIKRRSNMELLSESSEMLEAGELFLAVNESLDYLKLQGAETGVVRSASGWYPARALTLVYELFELFAEECMDNGEGGIADMMVNFPHSSDGKLYMRVMASCGGDAQMVSDQVKASLLEAFDKKEPLVSWDLAPNQDSLILVAEIEGGEPDA